MIATMKTPSSPTLLHLAALLACAAAAAQAADDAAAPPAAGAVAAPPQTLAMPAVVAPAALPPGAVVKITFAWQAGGPLRHHDQCFVHFIGAHGVAYTDNHDPEVPTDAPAWQGAVSYQKSIKIPDNLPAGQYQVAIGFYPKDGDKTDVLATAAGAGVSAAWPGAYCVGTLTVNPAAPQPKADTEGPKTLDLTGYHVVFDEHFAAPLDVSPWGPGTRWIAHTPWNGDFGDAKFVDPEPGFPFTIDHGVLNIGARKDLAKSDPVQATLMIDHVIALTGADQQRASITTAAADWSFVDGKEFAGMQGSFVDTAADDAAAVAPGGHGAGKLSADFSGGGNYDGALVDLGHAALGTVSALRLRVKAEHLRSFSVRLVDEGGQVHQKIGIPLAATADWQEVEIRIADIVGGEHWGGANDGQWHGKFKSVSVDIDRRDLATADQWGRKWRSGILCSCDPEGRGFAQQYGYFECRARMPAGPGVWPAFWLASTPPAPRPGVDVRKDNSWDAWMGRFDAARQGDVEIDVIEYYGHEPSAYQSTAIVWRPEPHHAASSKIFTRPNECTEGFHNYGTMVQPDYITMYFDGVAVWKTRTPSEHQRPLMMLMNLALGSGWPIDQVPDPSTMAVEYVRAYGADAAPGGAKP
jgi:hypothetical protein